MIMESPAKILEQISVLLEEAREMMASGQHDQAREKALEAIALDPRHLKSHRVLVTVLESAGLEKEAEAARGVMEDIRKENWKRQVEAEIRSRHEMLGEAIRHESL